MDLPDSLTRRRAVVTGVGSVVAGSGIVYGASTLESDQTVSRTAPVHVSSETTGLGVDLQGHAIMGSLDAPVDMYYWSDYQCPFCRRFERNAFPKLIENHVRSGTVRVVFIEFPYLGSSSMTAAVLDRCVWRQVRNSSPQAYWRWHSTLFEKQERGNSEWISKENLFDIASNIDGIDASAVESCVSQHRPDIKQSIARDVDQASQFGIQATPAFVLYNRDTDAAGKIIGAQPYERFDEAITRVQNT
ncbi:DsbA family protein [Halogeometricum sp. S1BR25-6]|uniref:DsbA family protein n=1 Tax=Halogeometricum salsisoli TaxID=2950536 RepID=A0ABU2GJS0_9EURY|nr:thioredoxin domain-containing protein [Halogeometricum sp. S1BR25-6]MDS0301067.1 DsbA family protein [Halogeometricum sp. S1BR25-6]